MVILIAQSLEPDVNIISQPLFLILLVLILQLPHTQTIPDLFCRLPSALGVPQPPEDQVLNMLVDCLL